MSSNPDYNPAYRRNRRIDSAIAENSIAIFDRRNNLYHDLYGDSFGGIFYSDDITTGYNRERLDEIAWWNVDH